MRQHPALDAAQGLAFCGLAAALRDDRRAAGVAKVDAARLTSLDGRSPRRNRACPSGFSLCIPPRSPTAGDPVRSCHAV
jgi:hypothetical protein